MHHSDDLRKRYDMSHGGGGSDLFVILASRSGGGWKIGKSSITYYVDVPLFEIPSDFVKN